MTKRLDSTRMWTHQRAAIVDRSKLNESKVVRRQFVVALCDPTTVLDLSEEPFD